MGKGEHTRQAILDVALASASRFGVEALTIGGLAQGVGLSKSGLFAHFDSKENLQVQVLEAARERFVESVVAPALRAPRGEPRLRALFERWLGWERSESMPGGCVFVQAAVELDSRPGPPRDAVVAAWRDWLAVLAGAARIAVEEGHFRRDLDVDDFAFRFHALTLSYHSYHRLLADPRAEERARGTFESLLADSRAR